MATIGIELPVSPGYTTVIHKGDKVKWTCATDSFKILGFSPLPSRRSRGKRLKGAGRTKTKTAKVEAPPRNPFRKSWPKSARKNGTIDSGHPKGKAVGIRYKYSFMVGTTRTDPIMDIRP